MGSVAWGVYGPFLMLMEQRLNSALDHPVYAFGYDWRSSNSVSGNQLSQFIGAVIAAHPGAQDAIVLTHSMGGLVLRGALQGDPGAAVKIRGVVHGAQPSTGAVVCYRRFFTGSVPEIEGRQKLGTLEWFLASVMGKTSAKFTYNMSGCPGPLQLLPTHVYQKYSPSDAEPWLSAAGVSLDLGDIYSVYRTNEWPGLLGPAGSPQFGVATTAEFDTNQVVNVLRENLTMAESFHRSIETTAHGNTLVFYSGVIDTEVGVEFDHYPSASVSWAQPVCLVNQPLGTHGAAMVVHKEAAGDGTVPTVSALCPAMLPARTPQTAGHAVHADVYSEPLLQEIALTYVNMLFAIAPGTSLGSP